MVASRSIPVQQTIQGTQAIVMLVYLIQTALFALMAFIFGAVLGGLIHRLFSPAIARHTPTRQNSRPQTPAPLPVGKNSPVREQGEARRPATHRPPPSASPVNTEPPPNADRPRSGPVTGPSSLPEGQDQLARESQTPDLVPEPAAIPEKAPAAPTPPDTVLPPLADTDGEVAQEFDEDQPVGEEGPAGGMPDQLQRVRGIGPKFEEKLNLIGIWHYRQIANWTNAEAEWVSRYLGFPGKVQQDDWIGQSNILVSGVDTEYSRKIDRERQKQ